MASTAIRSVIRGGHIWLRLRLGEEKVSSQGDHLNALIALNQDSIERHAPEVESGGAILFNADKLKVNVTIRDNVLTVPLPVGKFHEALCPGGAGYAEYGRRRRAHFCSGWICRPPLRF